MQLYNLQTQAVEEVPDDQADSLAISDEYAKPNDVIEMWNYSKNGPELVKMGMAPNKIWENTHNFIAGKKVPIIDQGEIRELEPEEAFRKIKEDGAFVPSGDELDQHKYSDPVGAFSLQAINTFMPGSMELGLQKAGLPQEAIDAAFEKTEEVDPVASTLGKIAGFTVGPYDKVGAASRELMEGAAKLLPSKKLAQQAVKGMGRKTMESAAKLGTQFAAEGAFLQGVENVKNLIVHDKDLTTDNLIANMGPSALISGGVGAAIGSALPALRAGANRVTKMIGNKLAKADAAAGNAVEYVETPISASALRKERSPYDPTKFGTAFDQDAKFPQVFVYDDGKKIAYVDVDKVPWKILDYNNEAAIAKFIDESVNDPLVKGAVYPDKLKTDFKKEVLDASMSMTNASDEMIDYLSKDKRTRPLANFLYQRKSLNRILETGELGSDAAKQTARDAAKQTADFLNKWKNTGDAYLDGLVNNVKRTEARDRAVLKQKIAEFYDGVVGFKDGKKLILMNVAEIPDEAILKGMQKFRNPTTRVGAGYNAILRHLGATKNDIKNFEKHFSVDERKVVETFMKEQLAKSKQGFYPSHDILLENMGGANRMAVQGMDEAVAKMENALFDTYGNSAPAKAGLTGSAVANKIRQMVREEFYDPATKTVREGASGVIDKLEDYAKSWENRVLPNGRELPFTMTEWRDRRISLDKSIERHFGKDNVPIDKAKLQELRTWMEAKISEAAKEHLPEDVAIPLLKDYNDSKLLFRMTVANDHSPSLFNFVEKGIASDKSKVRGLPVALPSLGAATSLLSGAGAIPGLAMGAATSAVGRNFADNKYYWSYLANEKLVPWMQKSWTAMNRGAKDFSNKFGDKVVATAMEMSISDADIKYLEKNQDKMKVMVDNPSAYTDNIAQAYPGMEQLSSGLGVELARKGYNALSFVYGKMPKSPYPKDSQIKWEPSLIEKERFKRYVNATLYPETIFKHFGEGYISNEEIETLKKIYPGMYSRFKTMVFDKLRNKPLSVSQRTTLKRVFGVDWGYTPPDPALIQQYDAQNEQAEQDRTRKTSGDFPGTQQTENERLQDK